jgi:hypothetical protein
MHPFLPVGVVKDAVLLRWLSRSLWLGLSFFGRALTRTLLQHQCQPDEQHDQQRRQKSECAPGNVKDPAANPFREASGAVIVALPQNCPALRALHHMPREQPGHGGTNSANQPWKPQELLHRIDFRGNVQRPARPVDKCRLRIDSRTPTAEDHLFRMPDASPTKAAEGCRTP